MKNSIKNLQTQSKFFLAIDYSKKTISKVTFLTPDEMVRYQIHL
jgi:hypothetical protein